MEQLKPLSYNYKDLEPTIDEQTMKVHHSGHVQTYVDKLNAAIKDTEFKNKKAEELILLLDKLPEEIIIAVRNNAGGIVNHNFFFSLLKKDVKISGEIFNKISENFGNFDKFKEEFSKQAMSLFGSGWVWLVTNKGKLEIMQTLGHDNPLSQGKKPLLVIDMWEHAYYLKHQNKKADYISDFFSIINWNKINELLIKV